MNLSAYAKSIAATVLGAVVPIIIATVTHHGTLSGTDLITAAVTAVVSGGAVYGVPNAKAAAAGIVVTVKTDVGRFLAVFTSGLPTLVEQAAQAAITPTPVTPVAVVAPTPPTQPPLA